MREKRFARDLSAVLGRLSPSLTPRDFAILLSPAARKKPEARRRNRKARPPRK